MFGFFVGLFIGFNIAVFFMGLCLIEAEEDLHGGTQDVRKDNHRQ